MDTIVGKYAVFKSEEVGVALPQHPTKYLVISPCEKFNKEKFLGISKSFAAPDDFYRCIVVGRKMDYKIILSTTALSNIYSDWLTRQEAVDYYEALIALGI